MASPKQCLFIDDDADDQDFFCEAAQNIDSSIVCQFANNGLEAIKILDDQNYVPDYIFIDMNMPKMNGRETLDEIRKLPRLDQVVIYMYSTVASPKITEEVLALGVREVLVKPSSITELQSLLESILR